MKTIFCPKNLVNDISNTSSNSSATSRLCIWLLSCTVLCAVLIIVGAYTRLQNAGLSIPYWKPITGILPPLNLKTWELEFELYKQFPEYKIRNFDLDLNGFKHIFMVEYLHRTLARAISLLYIIPGIYFLSKKYITKSSYAVITASILLQGVLGWVMVKSGLDTMPYVAPIKLALHLEMGLMVFCMLLYSYFKASHFNSASARHDAYKANIIFSSLPYTAKSSEAKNRSILFISIAVLLFTQILLGGLMAGTHAGQIYQSFPLMGNTFIPTEILEGGFDISDPVTIQFLHRMCGYALATSILVYNFQIFPTNPIIATFSSFVILGQICLGFASMRYNDTYIVPLMHNTLGIVICSIVVYYQYSKKYIFPK